MRLFERLNVYLSVDELHVVWALSITVSCTVTGTSLVAWVLGLSSVGIHLGEVKSSVESARKVAHVNIEGELVVLESKCLVGVVIGHEVDTGSDVGTGALGDELERQGVIGSGDTIGPRVVGTLNSAVGGAGHRVWAKLLVPGVSSVAVGVAGGAVKPSPVGIQNDLRVLGGANAAGAASLHGHSWMNFSLVGTDLLAADGGHQTQGGECESGVHLDGGGESPKVLARMKKEETL